MSFSTLIYMLLQSDLKMQEMPFQRPIVKIFSYGACPLTLQKCHYKNVTSFFTYVQKFIDPPLLSYLITYKDDIGMYLLFSRVVYYTFYIFILKFSKLSLSPYAFDYVIFSIT